MKIAVMAGLFAIWYMEINSGVCFKWINHHRVVLYDAVD